jgi:hypothetical protein
LVATHFHNLLWLRVPEKLPSFCLARVAIVAMVKSFRVCEPAQCSLDKNRPFHGLTPCT